MLVFSTFCLGRAGLNKTERDLSRYNENPCPGKSVSPCVPVELLWLVLYPN